jgi:hypothetical protein
MIASPFLTAVDEARLKIRGSRDPLGLVPLWGNLGRKVVTNLTTASTTIRGFTTLLLGYYFAEESAPTGRERDAFRLGAFLKIEQLAAYARWSVNGDGDLRGISEVRRRLSEDEPLVIGADSAGQILSNQKTYGLWGLYTMPARASGLLERDELVLTAEAREFVERQYVPILAKARLIDRVRQIMGRDRTILDRKGRDRGLLETLGTVLRPTPLAVEREFYTSYLVLARGADPRQVEFAEIVESELPHGEEFSLQQLIACVGKARARKYDELADSLERIRDLEALLVPLASLFSFVQQRDGVALGDVVTQIRKSWGASGLKAINPAAIVALRATIEHVYGDAATSKRFEVIAESLNRGEYRASVDAVVEHNAFVMSQRGGAEPWVVVTDGRLDVRYRDDGAPELPTRDELRHAWRDSFYLDPLKTIADQLRAA